MITSVDAGASWTDHEFGPAEGSLRLQAVDPGLPDRLLATLARVDGEDTVLVSHGGGQSFSEYARVTNFGGAAFAPDGRLWFGDAGVDGVPSLRQRRRRAAVLLDRIEARTTERQLTVS